MKTNTEFSPRPRRGQRRDGQSTRAAILDAAGKVFAERGFAEATSKEICERAGVNAAAVNYYFGGKESLYEEALVEAHSQMVSLEDLDKIITSDIPPQEKLRAFMRRMISTAHAASDLWGVRVFLREMASPSPFVNSALVVTVLPKAGKLRALLHQITGLPIDSARLQRALAFVIIPCIALLVFPSTLRSAVLPATTTDPEAMLEDMLAYALGGLNALSEKGDAPL